MWIFVICWLFLSSIRNSHSLWIEGNNPLPRYDDEIAVGTYNGKIFMIGGFDYPQQLVEYDIATQTITDRGQQSLSSSITGGHAQFWTQQANIVYLIHDSIPSTFSIFDMNTAQFHTNWNEITFNTNVGKSACLASTESFLFITGGGPNSYSTWDVLQILDLSTYSWINNPPSMLLPRHNHACIVYHGYLWSFGGADGYTVHDTNERIQVTGIIQNTWSNIDSLFVYLQYIRAVALYNTIYVIGGMIDLSAAIDRMHLFDATTGTMTFSPDIMPWKTAHSSPVIVDNILYVFGGFHDVDTDEEIYDWTYYKIPTGNPTSSSNSPTAPPSNDPTSPPSNDPVAALSNRPTSAPSNDPTSTPSNDPTAAPSYNPTSAPSNAPTVPLSNEPTIAPSDYHSTEALSSPSQKPTTSHTSFPPSFSPTNNISLKPTIFEATSIATDITTHPSSILDEESTYVSDTNVYYISTDNITLNESNPFMGMDPLLLTVLISIFILCACVCVGMLLYLYLMTKRNNELVENRNAKKSVDLIPMIRVPTETPGGIIAVHALRVNNEDADIVLSQQKSVATTNRTKGESNDNYNSNVDNERTVEGDIDKYNDDNALTVEGE